MAATPPQPEEKTPSRMAALRGQAAGALRRIALPLLDSKHAPHAWPELFAGLVVVTVAAAACAGLVAYYLNARPDNLVPHTSKLAIITQQILLDSLEIEARLPLPDPDVREDGSALWYHYDFDMRLPAALSAEAVIDKLRRRLEPRGVQVSLEGSTADTAGIRLGYRTYPFAEIRLRGGRRQAAPSLGLSDERTDLRPAAEALAAEAEKVLRATLPAEGTVTVRAPVIQRDGEAIWAFTRLEAMAPTPGAARFALRALRQELENRDADVTESAAGMSTSEADARPQELGPYSPAGPAILGASLRGRQTLEVIVRTEPQLPSIELPQFVAADLAIIEPSMSEMPLDVAADAPKVAIIVDDGGEQLEATQAILALDPALTLAILPDTTHGPRIAEAAQEAGFEVMLHMPMEPSPGASPYPNSIMTSMPRAEIFSTIDRALEQVPGARGLNNHTGAAFTADPAAMAHVIDYCKERGLFFVDSRTIHTSLAFDMAKAAGVPAAVRDVFLDNEPDTDFAAGQFEELIDVAVRHGSAIGITHFRIESARALEEWLPRLEEQGIELVPVSELLQ